MHLFMCQSYILHPPVSLSIAMPILLAMLLVFAVEVITSGEATLNGDNVVTVWAHRWCKKSLPAYRIVQKASKQYESKGIHFTFIIQEEELSKSQLPFPRIEIACLGKNIFYQNELTYSEFTYWLGLICLSELPECKKWMSPYFPISPQDSTQYTKAIEWGISHPAIKICKQTVSPLQEQLIPTISRLLEVPYFSEFTHNIRNHLIINKCTAILFTYQPESSLLPKFEALVKKLRLRDKTLGYQLPEQLRDKLVFVSHPQHSKIAQSLLEFLNIRERTQQMIVGFSFAGRQGLAGRIYPDRSDWGNKLTFWMTELHRQVSAERQSKLRSKAICTSDYIVHTYQYNSLAQLILNVQLHQKAKESKLKIIKKPVKWLTVHQHPFKLCFTGKQPQTISSLASVLDCLHLIPPTDLLEL